MKIISDIGIQIPQVYLPKKGTDLTKWAVIACDQFTSQPEYWNVCGKDRRNITHRDRKPVFVTGATGYIGASLVPRLLEAGYEVRCLARSPQKLAGRRWASDARVSIVEGDLSSPDGLVDVMRGCGPAFYLVHSMISAGADYVTRDREMAARFASAAR